MKTYAHKDLLVIETGVGADGEGSRSWSFSSPADAAKQRAEFEAALSEQDKAALTEAAARAAAGAK